MLATPLSLPPSPRASAAMHGPNLAPAAEAARRGRTDRDFHTQLVRFVPLLDFPIDPAPATVRGPAIGTSPSTTVSPTQLAPQILQTQQPTTTGIPGKVDSTRSLNSESGQTAALPPREPAELLPELVLNAKEPGDIGRLVIPELLVVPDAKLALNGKDDPDHKPEKMSLDDNLTAELVVQESSAASDPPAHASVQAEHSPEAQDLARTELIAVAEVTSRDGTTDVRLVLDDVRVHLSCTAHRVQGRLIVAGETERRLLESQLPDLRQALTDAGVQVEQLRVSQEPAERQQQPPNHQSPPTPEEVRSAAKVPKRGVSSETRILVSAAVIDVVA